MSNLPWGAEYDPRAPYNQKRNDERLFDIEVTFQMSKKTSVKTDDYVDEYDEYDDAVYTSTAETDWKRAYEKWHYTLPELLDKLREYVKRDMESCTESRRSHLEHLLEECEGWEVYDYEIL